MRSMWVISMTFLLFAGGVVLAQEKASVQSTGDNSEQSLVVEKPKKISSIRQVTIRQKIQTQKPNRNRAKLVASRNHTQNVANSQQQSRQEVRKVLPAKKVAKKKNQNN